MSASGGQESTMTFGVVAAPAALLESSPATSAVTSNSTSSTSTSYASRDRPRVNTGLSWDRILEHEISDNFPNSVSRKSANPPLQGERDVNEQLVHQTAGEMPRNATSSVGAMSPIEKRAREVSQEALQRRMSYRSSSDHNSPSTPRSDGGSGRGRSARKEDQEEESDQQSNRSVLLRRRDGTAATTHTLSSRDRRPDEYAPASPRRRNVAELRGDAPSRTGGPSRYSISSPRGERSSFGMTQWPAAELQTCQSSRSEVTIWEAGGLHGEPELIPSLQKPSPVGHPGWLGTNVWQMALTDAEIANITHLIDVIVRTGAPPFRSSVTPICLPPRALPMGEEGADATSSTRDFAQGQEHSAQPPRYQWISEQQVRQHLRNVRDLLRRQFEEGQAQGRDAVLTALQRSEHVAAEIFAESMWMQQRQHQELACSQQELAVVQRQLEIASESAAQLPQTIAEWQGAMDVKSETEAMLTDEIGRLRSAYAHAEITLYQAQVEGRELLVSRQQAIGSLTSFRHEVRGWHQQAKAEVDSLNHQLAQARNIATESTAQRDTLTNAMNQFKQHATNVESQWQRTLQAREADVATANQARDSLITQPWKS